MQDLTEKTGLLANLLNKSFVYEIHIPPDKAKAHKAGDPPKQRNRQEMYRSSSHDEVGAQLKGSRYLDGIENCKQTNTHWNANMAIANLRTQNYILPANMRVIQRNKCIR